MLETCLCFQAAQRRRDEQLLRNQQLQLEVLMEQRRSGLEARRKLEDLCRELQSHYGNLRVSTRLGIRRRIRLGMARLGLCCVSEV